jgi:DNA-binding CsgD family transcriptional regulator
MRLDPIATVEACYRPGTDEDAWLRGVLESLRPIDFGMGLFAEAYDPSEQSGYALERRATLGPVPEGVMEDLQLMRRTVPPELVRRIFSPAPPVKYAVVSAKRIGREALGLTEQFFRRWGTRDSLAMFAVDADGRSLMVGSSIPTAGRLPPARVVRQLERVAAHLVSGFRLRRALGGRTAGPEDAEAVLDPGGRVLHATGGARPREVREGLVDALRRSERARGRLRVADPEEALALWNGLIEGTWSLLDHAESDGRRFVLARRNAPGVSDPKALAPRERVVLAFAAMGHQNKYIAYLLGLSPSTVAAQLRSACRKLGFGSRREAIATFASLVVSGGRTPRPVEPAERGEADPRA